MRITTRCFSLLLTQSSQIRWVTFTPIVLSRWMKNGPSELLECSSVLEKPAAIASPATSPVGVVLGCDCSRKPLRWHTVAGGSRSRFNSSSKLWNCTKRPGWRKQSDISIANTKCQVLYERDNSENTNSAGSIGYKHGYTALKQDDGINNVDKHTCRMNSDSVKWKKIEMSMHCKYNVL